MADRPPFRLVAAASRAYAAPPTGEQRSASLARIIEGEIIPRLFVALAAPARAPRTCRAPASLVADDIAELARLLLTHDRRVAKEYVQMICRGGTPFDRICLDLLAPVARRLAELWEQNQCDFAQFSLGIERLEYVLREVGESERRAAW